MVDLSGLQIPRNTIKFMEFFKGHTTYVTGGENVPWVNRPGTLQEKYAELALSNKAGAEIYFTVNETSPQGRKAEHLESIRAVFADSDQLMDKPHDFPLTPSLITRTSTIDGEHKHHYYWLTTTADYVSWERVMQRICNIPGMDPAVHDLARILRVPGFKNHKSDTVVSVVGGTGRMHEWEDIKTFFPPLEVGTANSKTAAEVVGTTGEFNEMRYIDSIRAAEHIADPINSLIMHWAFKDSVPVIKKKIQDILDTVPDDIRSTHNKRYFNAMGQLDKWIKTAKTNVAAKYKAQDQIIGIESKVEIPMALDWDWSVLKSESIPDAAVPDVVIEAANEIGDWTGVGRDPAILSSLFITSAILSKNVNIHEIPNDLVHNCRAGICIVMDTGARKSAIYDKMNKPFFEFEDKLREDWVDIKNVNLSMKASLESKLKKILKDGEKGAMKSDSEMMAQAKTTGAIMDKIDAIQIIEPSIKVADITEEKLIRKLHENNGCIAVISDDARQIISNLTGKYSNSENTGESVYINALTGSDISYERVSSAQPINIKDPVLNALMFVQPDAALRLKNTDMYVPSGLAARIPMYFYPIKGSDIVGRTERRTINEDRMRDYYDALRALCLRRFENPLQVHICDIGLQFCKSQDKDLEKILKDKWDNSYDVVNKIISTSIIYSTCFAAIDDPQFRKVYADTKSTTADYTLPVKYLRMGFRMGRLIFGQTIASMDVIHYEAFPRKAKSVATTLEKWYKSAKLFEGFTYSTALANSFSPALREGLQEYLDFLLEKKYLTTTTMTDDKRKLNKGFPDKLVDTGETIYHLNVRGIEKKANMLIAGIKKVRTEESRDE